jgi:hypothetical protein
MLHQVMVSTPNNSGIAARSPLCGQFGMNYNPDKFAARTVPEGAAKKFKGAMDMWLQKVCVPAVHGGP